MFGPPNTYIYIFWHASRARCVGWNDLIKLINQIFSQAEMRETKVKRNIFFSLGKRSVCLFFLRIRSEANDDPFSGKTIMREQERNTG